MAAVAAMTRPPQAAVRRAFDDLNCIRDHRGRFSLRSPAKCLHGHAGRESGQVTEVLRCLAQ